VDAQDHIQMGVAATEMQDFYNSQSMNRSLTKPLVIDDPTGTVHRSMVGCHSCWSQPLSHSFFPATQKHKPVGRSASMIPVSQRSMDVEKHKKPSEKAPDWRTKSLAAAVTHTNPETFPDLPDGEPPYPKPIPNL